MALKGIDYETKPVNLKQGDQFKPDYLKINPIGQVPCLLIDGVTLTQSLPIIEYLDETRPGDHKILPSDHLQRFQARQIAEVINAGTQPLQNLSVLKMLKQNSTDKTLVSRWGNEVISRGYKTIEQILQNTAGDYSVGNSITLADLAIVPQMFNANRFKVDMSEYPTLDRVQKSLIKLEAFKQADPANQPDFDGEESKTWLGQK